MGRTFPASTICQLLNIRESFSTSKLQHLSPPKNISLLDAKGVIALGGADISPMRFLNTTAPIPSSLAETSGLSCHCQACQVSPATVTLSKMLHIRTRLHVLK